MLDFPVDHQATVETHLYRSSAIPTVPPTGICVCPAPIHKPISRWNITCGVCPYAHISTRVDLVPSVFILDR